MDGRNDNAHVAWALIRSLFSSRPVAWPTVPSRMISGRATERRMIGSFFGSAALIGLVALAGSVLVSEPRALAEGDEAKAEPRELPPVQAGRNSRDFAIDFTKVAEEA